MKLKKFVATIIAAVLMTAAFSGCLRNGSVEATMLRYHLDGAVTTLDPGRTAWVAEDTVIVALHEGLTRLDASGRPQPGLAERWDVSADGLTYTFHLRPGLTFSNGEPLTADDFVWTWKRNLAPGRIVPRQHLLFPVKGAEAYSDGTGAAADVAVRAADARTLVVTLEAPLPYFPALVALPPFMPLPEALVRSGDAWWQNADSHAGSGPFRLESYSAGDEIVVVKNEHYWDADAVRLDRVAYLLGMTPDTIWAEFQAGTLHVADVVPVSVLEPLRAQQHLIETPWWGTYYFEVTATPGSEATDPDALDGETLTRLTQALSLALDRERLARAVDGAGLPARAFIGPGFPAGRQGDFRARGGSYLPLRSDREAALAALAEAGYEEATDAPAVIIETGTDAGSHLALAEEMARMWRDTLGVDVRLASTVAAEASPAVIVRRRTWVPDFPDPADALERFVTGSGGGLAWSNRDYDAVMALARAEPDADVRLQHLRDAEAILLEQAPLIPIQHFVGRAMQQTSVKGVVRLPTAVTDVKTAYFEDGESLP